MVDLCVPFCAVLWYTSAAAAYFRTLAYPLQNGSFIITKGWLGGRAKRTCSKNFHVPIESVLHSVRRLRQSGSSTIWLTRTHRQMPMLCPPQHNETHERKIIHVLCLYACMRWFMLIHNTSAHIQRHRQMTQLIHWFHWYYSSLAILVLCVPYPIPISIPYTIIIPFGIRVDFAFLFFSLVHANRADWVKRNG